MKSKRIYLQPSGVVYRGILDLADSQNGVGICGDYERRTVEYGIMMLDSPWTLRFSVASIDMTRCEAALEVECGDADRDSDGPAEINDDLAGYVMRREFVMLDAMLLIGTPLETKFGERGDAMQ